ncbi:MAG TPA: hypothetical protein VGL86_25440 [Polyangia bacterium]|jgi:hypothetical protein
MEYPGEQIIAPARQQSMLAWILFALTMLAAIGLMLVEEQKLDAANARAAAAAKSEAKARVELGEVDGAKRALETRVQELQTENGRLTVKVAAAAKVDPPTTAPAHPAKKARRKHRRHH